MNGCCVDRDDAARNPAARGPKGCTPDTCMELPGGQTCADCRHEGRCTSMFGAESSNTYCGFFPRRFLAKRRPAAE